MDIDGLIDGRKMKSMFYSDPENLVVDKARFSAYLREMAISLMTDLAQLPGHTSLLQRENEEITALIRAGEISPTTVVTMMLQHPRLRTVMLYRLEMGFMEEPKVDAADPLIELIKEQGEILSERAPVSNAVH